MANLCSYEIRVKGTKESRDKFWSYINPDYNNNEAPHFARMQLSDAERNAFTNNDGEECDCITGACAWSLYSCMFNGPHTYFQDWVDVKLIDIESVSNDLHLELEMWSEETGMGFAEHYHIKDGEILIDECPRLTEKENDDGEWEYDEKPDNFWNFEYV